MINCPACGKENEDSAFECKRCRAPLREDMPDDHHAHAEAAPEPGSESLGEVCRRCEAYNEPGVRVCSNCGFKLFADALAEAAPPPASEPAFEQAPMDKTPPQAYAPPHDATPPDGSPSLSDELAALSISDQEAEEAGLSTGNNGEEPSLDKTPPQAYAAHEPVRAEPPARGKVAEVAAAAATAAGVAVGAAVGIVAGRRAPPAVEARSPPPAAKPAAPEPPAAPAEKLCSSCGASNPPAAKFCFDCGTPFAKKAPEPKSAPPPPEPVRAAPPPSPPPPRAPPPSLPKIEPMKLRVERPPSIQVAPSIQIDPELSDSTAESAPLPADEPLPEGLPAEEAFAAEPLPEEVPLEEPLPEELPAEEAFAGEPLPDEEPAPEPLAEPIEEEAPPPFQASLVVEKGASQGTAFLLAHRETSIGGSGAHVEFTDDPYVAPHAATLLFAEDHLVVRDEGSANGVFVKVRESAPLEPGDLFVAGERLFRYDGQLEMARDGEGETPFLGAPRPPGPAVRVTEVLSAGKTGRTCHRAGPTITIGRTGCDMNFPADGLMAAKHTEVRLSEDGAATLVDLGQGPGVFIRVRAQSQLDLHAGDILMVGEQQLRVEVG